MSSRLRPAQQHSAAQEIAGFAPSTNCRFSTVHRGRRTTHARYLKGQPRHVDAIICAAGARARMDIVRALDPEAVARRLLAILRRGWARGDDDVPGCRRHRKHSERASHLAIEGGNHFRYVHRYAAVRSSAERETLNIGSENEISILALPRTIVDLTKSKSKIAFKPPLPGGPQAGRDPRCAGCQSRTDESPRGAP
jgi:hypothetical protein